MRSSRRGFLAGSSAALIAGAAPRAAWGRTEADVAIIGAGLAGLHAAKLCEDAGLKAVVIEAKGRPGGRLHTLDDLPGAPDAGGIQIGAGYKRLHAIADRLGVERSTGSGAGAGRSQVPGNLYHINGISTPSTGWVDSAGNRLSGDTRAIEPARLLRHFSAGLPPLDKPSDWLEAAERPDRSLEALLRTSGADDEALRLITANFNGSTPASMSALHTTRSTAIFRSQPGPISTIKGGSQRLTEAMAGDLDSPIMFDTPVQAIAEDASGVTLPLADQTLRVRQVICTIPFAALRTIPLSVSMPSSTARMIAELPYTRASFAFLQAKEPFWEEDGLPATLWSDDPLIGRVFVLGRDPAMLKLWTTGSGADLLDRMPLEAAAEEIISRIETARPSARGKLTMLRRYSWQNDPYARGIYHHIGTGMAADLATAVQHAGSRVHFAGEHMAIGSSGMEAALESGETAANRVLQRI